MYGFSLVRLVVLILTSATLKQSINNKMVRKIYVGMCTTDIIYTNANIYSHL